MKRQLADLQSSFMASLSRGDRFNGGGLFKGWRPPEKNAGPGKDQVESNLKAQMKKLKKEVQDTGRARGEALLRTPVNNFE